MFCPNCGTQLLDEANFCWKCGKVQQGTTTTSNEPQYEHCRIELVEVGYRLLQGTFYRFDADAIGTKGPYVAGQSKEFIMSDKVQPAILDALIQHLVAGGWEAVETKGSQWYQHSFRRRAKLDTGEKAAHFDVVLLTAGKRKIEVIKALRQLKTNLGFRDLGFREAKDLADTPGAVILQNISKEQAEDAKLALQKAGGIAKIQ